MAVYATVEQIQALADEPDSTASTDAWELIANAASRLFDRLTEVSDDFYAANDGTATARTYRGDGTAYLFVDPFLSSPTPTVAIPGGEYTVDAGDIAVYGNALVFPEKTILLNEAASSFPNRYTGWQDSIAVSVTAKWGFAEIPQDIVYAVCQLALMQWRQREPAVAITAELPGIGSLPIPTTAKMVVDKYKALYSRKAIFA